MLSFENSSAIAWGTGTVSITGFRPGVIQFGTDATGLSAGQLSAIDGGAYTINSEGFLIPEPSTLILMLISGVGLLVFRRRRG